MSLRPFLGSVNLNHFRLLRVVGRGAFGKVRIVERKDTGLSFALKYIRKDEGVLTITTPLHYSLFSSFSSPISIPKNGQMDRWTGQSSLK